MSAQLRLLLTLTCLLGVFALHGRPSTPPDFQVWLAADAVANAGENPYDIERLNEELRSDPSYGSIWQDSPERFRMRFFNPPTWLTLLRSIALSPLLMMVAGIATLGGSLVVLSRGADDQTFVGYLFVCALVLVSPLSMSTYAFGQTGLLLAGLLGVRLVGLGRLREGMPLALLSFKPHIALAAALPAMIRRPTSVLAGLFIPALLVVAATALLYGPGLFGEWIGAVVLGDHSILPLDDMTLRTLSPRWPLPASLNLLTVLLSLVVIGAVSHWGSADPALMVLFSVALTIFLSGHGFAHDWLWIVFIPAVCTWTIRRCCIATLGILLLYLVNYDVEGLTELPVVSSPSLVAAIIVGYLSFEVIAASANDRGAIETTQVLAEV